MRFSQSARFEVIDLGRADYLTHEARMFEALDEVLQGGPDRLLLAECDPVLTVGRAAQTEAYRLSKLPVYEVNRGGKATFHGPGQLVVWPVIALHDEARDLHKYLHALEESLIIALQRLGVAAGRDARNTGVWVAKRKLASIGVAVRRWVAYHGLALNVSTDMHWFQQFDPCGLEPDWMTSLQIEMGETPDPEAVQAEVVRALREVLTGE